MTRITEPHWGRPVGRVDDKGNVIFSGQVGDLMRALVKRLLDTESTVSTVQATQNEQADQITTIVNTPAPASDGLTAAQVAARVAYGV